MRNLIHRTVPYESLNHFELNARDGNTLTVLFVASDSTRIGSLHRRLVFSGTRQKSLLESRLDYIKAHLLNLKHSVQTRKQL